ncbi:hypothetical protein GQ600_12814 [Phytophthora cactorum]|nr:hypothetical protein GQ600_12814 [Phytophthora cactorum]
MSYPDDGPDFILLDHGGNYAPFHVAVDRYAQTGLERLNVVQKDKQGKDVSTVFSAVDYESLPKRFRTDDGTVTQ